MRLFRRNPYGTSLYGRSASFELAYLEQPNRAHPNLAGASRKDPSRPRRVIQRFLNRSASPRDRLGRLRYGCPRYARVSVSIFVAALPVMGVKESEGESRCIIVSFGMPPIDDPHAKFLRRNTIYRALQKPDADSGHPYPGVFPSWPAIISSMADAPALVSATGKPFSKSRNAT